MRCIAIWLPTYSASCNNQVTDLSSGTASEMKEQETLILCESRVDYTRKIDSTEELKYMKSTLSELFNTRFKQLII